MWSMLYMERHPRRVAAFVKCYAFDIEHPHAQFSVARRRRCDIRWRRCRRAMGEMGEYFVDLGEALLTRQLVYDVIKGNQSEAVTDALLLMLGPSILKCKGAATKDNLSKLYYRVYAQFAAGESDEMVLDKRQSLRDGICRQALRVERIIVRGRARCKVRDFDNDDRPVGVPAAAAVEAIRGAPRAPRRRARSNLFLRDECTELGTASRPWPACRSSRPSTTARWAILHPLQACADRDDRTL